MRFGLALGFEDSLHTMITAAHEGEAAGFDSIHVVEAGRSAFVSAAAVAQVTSACGIGIYVANAYAREPWLTGIAARDLDELCGGRLMLGVGTGNVHFNDWYMGIDSTKPMAKMREYVPIVRAVVAGERGAPVRFQGDEHQIRWRASWQPTRSAVPVYMSASGPNMVNLAGQVADGVAIGIMSSVEFVRDRVCPNARAGAETAGRDPSALAFPMAAMVSVNADRDIARRSVKEAICNLFHPVPHPYYDSQLRQLGFSEFADQASELMPRGRLEDAVALVPDAVVDSMTIAGTIEDCAARIAQYQGVADEVIAFRIAQPGEPKGAAAFESIFALAARVSG